ncbi:DUF4867 family protein [Acidaminobacter sp. JC074]|uniref:DUF4867 family protein n=1 Tax=Acidaminobacter sp. JC074 TaxID=2530199 RepID=UPI001F0F9CA9|nr:DUF4867 family protein [Acidaminobacter sp. JC074]MCH4887023.1 DUF4867 family protein [Acidaminobacter sp. JC074]
MKRITDQAFNAYGCPHQASDFSDVYKTLKYETPTTDQVEYVADFERFSKMKSSISYKYFGEQSIQIGYCNGLNRQVDALEYHKSSEIIVAGTDLILVLGKRQDIKEGYDISLAESFLMKEGEVVEIYGPTLHYCPVNLDGQFKAAIILPEGTNTGSDSAYAKNKWLYAHPNSPEAKGNISGYLKGDLLKL